VTLSPALKQHLAGFGRMALHARILGFEHPVTGAGVRFERPAPPNFERLFECLQAELAGPGDSRSANHGGGKLGA
jgi:23S rRNA pseudouridine1911/1915/1917 synthase